MADVGLRMATQGNVSSPSYILCGFGIEAPDNIAEFRRRGFGAENFYRSLGYLNRVGTFNMPFGLEAQLLRVADVEAGYIDMPERGGDVEAGVYRAVELCDVRRNPPEIVRAQLHGTEG